MKELELTLFPVYEIGRSPHTCRADMMTTIAKWDKRKLKVSWDSKEKQFLVEFFGKRKAAFDMYSLPDDLSQTLSRKVPLEIAQSSQCECGSRLELGDYTVEFENGDFKFQAVYFCPLCKAEAVAQRKGFKGFFDRWFEGLNKIEIKATGVGIERR